MKYVYLSVFIAYIFVKMIQEEEVDTLRVFPLLYYF